MAISSVVLLLSFSDFGLGNGLLNAVAESSGSNDRRMMQKSVSSAFFLLSSIAAVLTALFFLLYPTIAWGRVFNVKSGLASLEVGPTCLVFFLCFAISLPLGIVQKVQIGLQEGFRNNIWQAAGSLAGLIGLIAAVTLHAGLPWLIGAVAGLPVLTTGLNWLFQFQRSRPWLFPRLTLFDRSIAWTLAGRGGMFFFSQVGAALTTQAPILLILRYLGPSSVPEYAVASRAISVLLLINSLMLGPFWPAYAEAMSSRDVAWIRRTFHKTLGISLAISLTGATAFFCTYQRLIPLWVSDRVTPTVATAGALAVFAVFYAIHNASSMCLNGCNRLLGQVIYQIPTAVLGIALAIRWSDRYGVGGIAIAFTLAEACLAILQFIEVQYFFRQISGRSDDSEVAQTCDLLSA
jgi:O-antigen/teichoic acid export membrane protein